MAFSTLTPTKGVLLIDRGAPLDSHKSSIKKFMEQILKESFPSLKPPLWLQNAYLRYFFIPFHLSHWVNRYQAAWTPQGFLSHQQIAQDARALQKMFSAKRNADSIHFKNSNLKNDRSIKNHTERLSLEEQSLVVVDWAFQYEEGSLAQALHRLQKQNVQELVIVPLYPQWSLETRGQLEQQFQELKEYLPEKVHILPPFYQEKKWIEIQSDLLRESLPIHFHNEDIAVVYSFKGFPIHHLKAVTPICKKCLKRSGECRPDFKTQPYCYRFQCFETARQISTQVGLFFWDVSFQNALPGLASSLAPSLREITDELLEQGIRTMIIQCPSLIYDDVENLNDIARELQTYFKNRGGKELILVPTIHHSSQWLDLLQQLIISQLPGYSLPEVRLEPVTMTLAESVEADYHYS